MGNRKIAVCLTAAALSAAMLLTGAVGWYKNEEASVSRESFDERMLSYAAEAAELAKSLGMSDESYPLVPEYEPPEGSELDELNAMAASAYSVVVELGDVGRLNRLTAKLLSSDELSAELSPGAGYSEICAAAAERYRGELAEARRSGAVREALCVAVFCAGIVGATLSALKLCDIADKRQAGSVGQNVPPEGADSPQIIHLNSPTRQPTV